MIDKRVVLLSVLASGLALCANGLRAATEALVAQADDPMGRIQNGDPYLPPASRTPSTQPPSTGEALKAQVLQKLQRDFAKADVEHAGSITQAQADHAGLGLVARHFDKIDSKRAGRVTFDQVREYLQAQGARL
jgi:hypothetical protein